MKPLILGDGKLASEIIKQTGWNYISRKRDGFDFVDIYSYEDMLEDYDTIINCIANTNTTDNTKKAHWDVNYVGVVGLTSYCAAFNKKLVHISSDYLYANSVSNASEEDVPVHENNWYCYTKMLADGYVQIGIDNYLLIRTSFKARPFPWPSAWIDMLTNADYVDTIATYIIKLIKCEAIGIYNVGTQMKTFYDLAKQTNPTCKPSLDDYSFHRPHDVTMNLDKMNKKLNDES